MAFVVLKSYDGGKQWVQGREYNDFASAASAALALGAREPSIRYRVDVKSARMRRTPAKGARGKRSPR